MVRKRLLVALAVMVVSELQPHDLAGLPVRDL
jgi:hypothetical protein